MTDITTTVTASETWLPRDRHAQYLKSLEHRGEAVSLKRGASLFVQGQTDRQFYVVLDGKLYVSMISEDGHEAMLDIMGRGSLIGEAASFLELPRYTNAHAAEDSRLIRFDSKQAQALMSDPQFASALLYLMHVKQRQLVARLRQSVFESPEQRVVNFLKRFFKTHFDPDHPSTPIIVDLTHEQIGTLTDLSRVTVTRVLNKLKRDARIEVDGRKIILRADNKIGA